MDNKVKRKKLTIRAKRVRGRIGRGTADRPRLSVFRSNQHIYGQLIDDAKGVTLISASSHEVKGKGTKEEKSKKVGALIAEKAKKSGIEQALFDRGGYRYQGRVKNMAEGARENGLKL